LVLCQQPKNSTFLNKQLMPDPNRKSIADALAAMASGQELPAESPAAKPTVPNSPSLSAPRMLAAIPPRNIPADFAPPAGLRPTVRSRVEFDKSLHRKQTLIPIFLTIGALFGFLGIWVVIADFDSAILDVLPRWAGWVLLCTCLASWILASVNMLGVARKLKGKI
jgi:hypothetical protein